MTFVPSVAGMTHLLRDLNGPVAHHLDRLLDRCVEEAAAAAPVGTGEATGPRLGESMERTRLYVTTDGVAGRVGSKKRYAAAVVLGARPHVIQARNASVLRFEGDGGTVFTPSVQHPGNAANPFLQLAVQRVIRGV